MTTARIRTNLEGFIGHGLDLDLTITENGVARDITNDTLTFLVKAHPEAADGAAVITKTSASGAEISLTDPVNGGARVILKAVDTASLFSRSYFYALSVVTPSARDFLAVDGVITFTAN